MDSFDKKVADLYNKNQSPDQLPEGFAWDDMSEGIYDKMESPERKRKPVFWWLTFGSFILLFSVAGLFLIQKSNNTNLSHTINTSLPNIKEETTFPNSKPIAETAQAEKESTTIRNTQADISNHNFSNNLIVSINKNSEKADQKSKTTDRIDVSILKDLTSTESGFVINTSSPEISVSGAEDFVESVNEKESADILTIPASATKTVVPPTLPIRWVTFSSNKITAPDQLLQKNEPTHSRSKIMFQFTPEIYGGTLLTTGKYTGNQERNTYSRWSPGYFAGIDFTVLTYKKWSLNMGYEHKLAVQILELSNIIDTVSVTIENALTGITTNSLNGTTMERRENIATKGVRTRNFLYYNTFRSHALRLTVHRSFAITPRWHLSTGFGGTYNFFNQATGTTLDADGNRLRYTPDMPIYQKRSFAVEAGLSLEYKIGRIRLTGNLWLEKSLSLSLEPNNSIKPVFYKIGAGAAYQF